MSNKEQTNQAEAVEEDEVNEAESDEVKRRKAGSK